MEGGGRKDVQVVVDLAKSTVLGKETTEDTLAAHPKELPRATRVLGTTPATKATVPAETPHLVPGG